ncbi:hypothetical protein [Devosia aurantiaca]|uniref:Uncharacterized protein n=1 Tax=Devosia aurantiaca TaxID=2714858 RepID=A0A6M1SRB6_9HYPH|nr:hypothetical protein [Devosia aurantiaca]NGP16933.1 hypothetical protein [Devosia aurantiaca]
MRAKPCSTISRRMAERHENLLPMLQVLARKLQSMAARSPNRAVPDDLRSQAEAMLFEVEVFRERRQRPALPVGAPHYRGLASQLTEALAAMIAFEQRHVAWNAATEEPQWNLAPGKKDGRVGIMKVKRLTPRPGSKAAARADAQARLEEELRAGRMLRIRAALVDRLTKSQRTDGP